MPPNTIYVGRPTKWGNPFITRGRFADIKSAEDAVSAYEENLDPATMAAAKRELAGRDLACWCKLGEPCHADVLLKIANAGVEPAKE